MKVMKSLGRHAPVQDLIAANQQHQRNRHRADRIHQWRTDGLNSDTAQIGAEKTLGGLLEAQNLPQFSIEGLDDAVAGYSLMKNILNFGELVLSGAGARFELNGRCGARK